MADEWQREDEDLVREARDALRGDGRAFEALVSRYEARVLTNCRFLTGSAAEAEDLAQEVFVKAYFALPRFEGRSKFGTWVHRIKVNHCLNHMEKQERRAHVNVATTPETTAAEPDPRPTAEREMIGRDERLRIESALERLPEKLRVPLVLREIDGMSYQEISDTLQLGLSAVKMRIKRAREAFRSAYEARGSGGAASVS